MHRKSFNNGNKTRYSEVSEGYIHFYDHTIKKKEIHCVHERGKDFVSILQT